MCERVGGKTAAVETAIGNLPSQDSLDIDGLDIPAEDLEELLRVDTDAWKAEIPDIEQHFAQFGERLPARLKTQLENLKKRLG